MTAVKAVILWALCFCLLTQGYLGSMETTDRGCMKWTLSGANVCCEACHPGNRLIARCGPNPKDLCEPCKTGTFTVNPLAYRCDRCRGCYGALVLLKECTATTNTKCGCKEGLICGDDHCSFCVTRCDKGQEPTEDRLCRPCPDGTFNDQVHQKCKPWSTKCPSEGQHIVAKGDAFTDMKCSNISVALSNRPIHPDPNEQAWPLILSVVVSVALMGFTVIIIITVARKIAKKRKKTKKAIPKTPIIRTPTDDPRTLIAIECSFHEAQQEQGSSSESLDSKDSSDQLIE
uniref:TNFR-Cys domain-containing protein n=1 Tax=Monopterus albus TaxID=43700 RepID=A0A3Q3QTP1_MONAL|nr:tumor necrosis factor receptor superfamily member 9-like [Monopterus albus]